MNKTLESFKLKEAWTYLFKEKQWGLKLLLPVVPAVIFGLIAAPIFIIATLLVFNADSKPSADLFAAAGVLGSVLLLCLCCVVAVFAIVQSIITYWYQYEYTQVALEDRESVVIIKPSKMDVIKRAVKLALVNLIYNIPTSIVVGFFYALFIVTGGVRQTRYVYGMMNTGSLSAVGVLLFCLVMLIVIFIVVPYNFYIVQTAKVRLIRTNTFREAFRIRTIIESARKNFKTLSIFLGVLLLYVLVYIVVSMVISILSVIPFVGLCLIPFNIVLSIAVGFFSIFVYPYMLGKAYKEVK